MKRLSTKELAMKLGDNNKIVEEASVISEESCTSKSVSSGTSFSQTLSPVSPIGPIDGTISSAFNSHRISPRKSSKKVMTKLDFNQDKNLSPRTQA